MADLISVMTYGPISTTTIVTSRRRHPLDPILKSFLIFGIDIEEKEVTGHFTKILYKVWSVIVILFYHYYLISDFAWYVRRSAQENAIAESTSVWASIITFDLLLIRKKHVKKTVHFVYSETMKLSEKERKRFEKIVLIVCCIVWVYVCVFVTQHGAFKHREKYGEFHTTTLLHMVYKKLDEPMRTIVAKFDKCMESFFIQGLMTLTMALYLLLCLNARLWFKNFQQHFENHECLKLDSNTLDIRHFTSSYEILANNVQILDDGFSQIVASWLLMILVTLCVRIISVLNPVTVTTNQMLTVIILTFARAITALIGTSFIGDSVYNESLTAISLLFKLRRTDSIVWKSTTFYEIQLALARYSFNPTQLTVWKFARLNRGFLMTCLGMMTTYIIIAIQLYPNAMKGLKSLS
ncbi:uncharacterized protein TNIN_172991 [Trichonephila inaurata madagascariensis]|uniref:Gustatory receptor n=1 Tax=Trichonephila inaurata madagascariensis TaxID=2747483 RepID=A0A8X6X6E3_9ARAC|nr:uncharacterized protein TNIN_172991 [Trichonephila inaurata madagascariensis]